MKRTLLYLWLAVLLAACQEADGLPHVHDEALQAYLESDDIAVRHARQVRYSDGHCEYVVMINRSIVSLCETAFQSDGGFGLYRVLEILEVTEQHGSAEPERMLYYTLEASGPRAVHSPEALTVRVSGCLPLPLAVSEESLVFLNAPRDEPRFSRGFATASPFALLTRQPDGTFRPAASGGSETSRTLDELVQSIDEVYAEFGTPIHPLSEDGSLEYELDETRCPASAATFYL